MYRRLGLLVLTCVCAQSETAIAQVERDAAAIADRYLAAMQRKRYAFLSEDELSRRRDRVAAFAAKYLHERLDEPTRVAMLDSIDPCIDRLYSQPAGKVEYGNGFGSGGEEWMYLNDRDYFLTFQYYLWMGLMRETLSPADLKRRDAQRQWMRQYLANLPHLGTNETPPREGMSSDQIRPWVMAQLERAFANPLNLLSKPMPDDGFTKLQDRFKQFSNGICCDSHDMEVAALDSRFVEQKDPAGRFGYTYSGKLPFDDSVVSIWANGPSLCFASNADYCGHYGSLSPSDVYDVVRCIEMRAKPAAAPAAMETWLARERRGEFTVDDSTLLAVRGAIIADLPVKNWFDADKLSDDQLRTAIRDAGQNRISITRLPPMNGPHRGDRSEGEFFVVVQNRENRLAVINLYNHEFHQLMFWCRPRTAKPKTVAVPATQP